MWADIVTGESDWSEVAFLVAIVLAGIAGFLAWPEKTIVTTLGWLAVAAVATGLLLL